MVLMVKMIECGLGRLEFFTSDSDQGFPNLGVHGEAMPWLVDGFCLGIDEKRCQRLRKQYSHG